jgi:hypothetical protein
MNVKTIPPRIFLQRIEIRHAPHLPLHELEVTSLRRPNGRFPGTAAPAATAATAAPAAAAAALTAGGGGGGYSGGGGGGSIIDSSAIMVLAEVSGVASPDGSPKGEIIISPVPEPSVLVLLAVGATAILGCCRRVGTRKKFHLNLHLTSGERAVKGQ